MGFLYTPITEKEAIEERYQLLKEGIYDAVIVSSQDKVSQSSGNPMMDMTLQVFDENGRARTVRDFLVFTRSMMWKVINFAQASNLMKEYEDGKLCSDSVINARLRVKIAIEEGSIIPDDKLRGSSPGARYPDKNRIEDYIKNESAPSPEMHREELDDDVPF